MKYLIPLFLLIFLPAFLQADNATKVNRVYTFEIRQEIGPAVWRLTKKAMEEAKKMDADAVIIHMNTYGGMVNYADSIRTLLLNFKIPVYVFIDNNAASAGALISIACDGIYMRPGANIGAATVVSQDGKPVPDKYQSYMRSMMRSTAEAHGKDTIINNGDTIIQWFRNPAIAESMVGVTRGGDSAVIVDKVLTYTTEEALKNGFCEGQAETIEDVAKQIGLEPFEISKYQITGMDKIMHYLLNPILQGILIMLIVAGIYYELQTPGIGFPLGIAITAALLYFAPLYLEGLANHWEILVFIIGLILIGLELFVIPGFGVTGISGIILVILGLSLSMVKDFDFELNPNGINDFIRAFALVVTSVFVSLAGSIWLSSKLLGVKAFSGLVLSDTLSQEHGFVSTDPMHELIGKKGTASTVLRPSGSVHIEGNIYDARSEMGFIDKEATIVVIGVVAAQLIVRAE